MTDAKRDIAVFGGGCFWCTEAVFQQLTGVLGVTPGYAGGFSLHEGRPPTYEEVSSGKTEYAEVIQVEFDPAVIGYDDLLTVFFATHDPKTPNRQGNDVGPQYRSIILYRTEDQKEKAERAIAAIEKKFGAPLATAVEPLKAFYGAEAYHKDYYERNREAPYCRAVIRPKIEKVKKEFTSLLRDRAM